MLPKRGGQEGSGQISVPPALYNYFQTSRKPPRTSSSKDYSKFSQLFRNLLPAVCGIGLKYGCGSITKDAGNIMRAIYHSWNPIHTKKYLSKYIYLKQKGLAAILNFLLITAFQRPYAEQLYFSLSTVVHQSNFICKLSDSEIC